MLINPFGIFTGAVVLSNDEPAIIKTLARAAKLFLGSYGSRIQICDGVNDDVEIQNAVDYLIANNGGEIFFSGGNFSIQNVSGISITNANNLIVSGQGNTILKKHQIGGYTGQILEVVTSNNIVIRNIIFDQDRSNADHTYNPTSGLQWIFRHSGDNHLIEKCSFINGLQSGIVSGIIKNSVIRKCSIDNLGEHGVYLDGSLDESFEDCQIYNWGKKKEGHGFKIVNSSNVSVTKCRLEQNDDILGKGGSIYGSVVSSSTNIIFEKCYFKGDGTQNYCFDSEATANIIKYINCYFLNHGAMIEYSPNITTSRTEIINCYFSLLPVSYAPSFISNCYFFDCNQIIIAHNGVVIDKCIFKRENITQNFELIYAVGFDDIIINDCKFFNWTYRGLFLHNGSDSIISNCYFSGGVTSGWVTLGTRTRVMNNIWENDISTGAYITDSQSTGVNCIWSGNYMPSSLIANMVPSCYSNMSLNTGYIAPSETRTFSGSLVPGVINAISFAWHNPEFQDIYIKKIIISITTGGGTVGSHLDVGISDDSIGTNRGTEFFNDLLLNNIQINESLLAADGGTQTKWVFCQDNISVTDGWIVGQILDANASLLAGSYYIEYCGK